MKESTGFSWCPRPTYTALQQQRWFPRRYVIQKSPVFSSLPVMVCDSNAQVSQPNKTIGIARNATPQNRRCALEGHAHHDTPLQSAYHTILYLFVGVGSRSIYFRRPRRRPCVSASREHQIAEMKKKEASYSYENTSYRVVLRSTSYLVLGRNQTGQERNCVRCSGSTQTWSKTCIRVQTPTICIGTMCKLRSIPVFRPLSAGYIATSSSQHLASRL